MTWNMIAGAGGFMAQTGMRLPTEAEWEYAYRAGTSTAFHGWAANPIGTNNDTLVGNIAWYSSNSNSQTRPVGGKAANGFGLHDMAGNVFEWVNDWYGDYSAEPQVNPQGHPTGQYGQYRVLRGGSWGGNSASLRAYSRGGTTPDYAGIGLGCRAARSPNDAPAATAVSPTSGPTAGGTLITLTGTNLLGATGVTFGGVAASSVQVINATTVTAVTPGGTAGTVTVAITTPSGTASLPGAFTYVTVPSWATLIEAQPDPAVVWDPALRQAIIATGRPWRVRDTATQMEMLLIPPGTFQMGEEGWATPVHQVTLTNAFYLGRYEVTQAQWQARMGSNPSFFQSPSSDVPADQVPNRPVERVSWNMIAGAGGFMAQTGMRLPTEAEWEYAYRAGTTTAFHGFTGYPNGTNDDTLVGSIGWWGWCCGGNSGGYTHPVGQKLGNGFGLHDMAGNVWEWVNDWYGSYSSGAQTDPTGPTTGAYRVFRGGSWLYGYASTLRASHRNYNTPDRTVNYVGCRAARAP
jgi:formylglycine-generating enzyme required for sulfatase activity